MYVPFLKALLLAYVTYDIAASAVPADNVELQERACCQYSHNLHTMVAAISATFHLETPKRSPATAINGHLALQSVRNMFFGNRVIFEDSGQIRTACGKPRVPTYKSGDSAAKPAEASPQVKLHHVLKYWLAMDYPNPDRTAPIISYIEKY
ncbi:hypothetical protein TWF970_000750 [Orbilia oligospora]|uniref:Uncharacterized protein n=1 Tax=Orbilia oligospora TaxID=2813651 RepID=A0A7C8W0P0_ORBOL|nr:hypothetical protein TWF970_000750 [Orbilia oligospora]